MAKWKCEGRPTSEGNECSSPSGFNGCELDDIDGVAVPCGCPYDTDRYAGEVVWKDIS